MPPHRSEEIPVELLDHADQVIQERFRRLEQHHPALEQISALGREQAARDMLAGTRPKPDLNETGRLIRQPLERPEASLKLGPLQLLVNEIKLPALPQVLLELMQILDDPNSSAKDLAEVIRLDASLASYLLRLVNSAYYSFPFPIDTVDRAVTLLGTREISSLAVSSSFLKMFKESSARFVTIEEFWKHSISCGTAARVLARRCGRSNPERHFVAGLLHDLGRLVIFVHLPDLAEEMLAVEHWRDVSLYQAEGELLGFDHGRFGATLLANWNFPKTLVAAVQHHHAPQAAHEFDEPKTVHLANLITNGLGLGSSGDDHVPPLDVATWDELGLAADELPAIVEELQAELKTMLSPIST